MIIVAQNGSGDFKTIQEAVDSISINNGTEADKTIFIKRGVYKEQLEIKVPNLKLEGEDRDETIITNTLGAFDPMPDGKKRGTFRSYTVFIDASQISLYNLTIRNEAGIGSEKGQAIALYAEGDLLQIENCNLIARQDTLFTGPLPEKELIPDGFLGPKQFSPRINGRQLYRNCFISGDIDFIFGSATAYFESCEIFSHTLNQEVNGYVTAPSTPKGQTYGYVFQNCCFTSNCPDNSVYLGRPWRNYAKAVFINCELGSHIKKEGFHDWDKTESHHTTFFAEYQNYGPGAEDTCREPWVHSLSPEDISQYSIESIFKK
ncbi:pectinesterase family protein [Anaeromicropila populeti]|uniref:Pectinesterase n=1 Tax=Anaeromicropila populeti TaxID=37658 RepID=A0A1I6IP53_9FIRM|nr:pectinesterase family protein [Anaeromicropila populeti]SFR68508.1 pectinesterase [Anaeromicropila populeti]